MQCANVITTRLYLIFNNNCNERGEISLRNIVVNWEKDMYAGFVLIYQWKIKFRKSHDGTLSVVRTDNERRSANSINQYLRIFNDRLGSMMNNNNITAK